MTGANVSQLDTRLHSEASEKAITDESIRTNTLNNVHTHWHIANTETTIDVWVIQTQRQRETRLVMDRDFHGGRSELAHQFPRSSGAQAHIRAHRHRRRYTPTRTSTTNTKKGSCFTNTSSASLASVSSELSTGPVAFPFDIHGYLLRYLVDRTYYRRHVRDQPMIHRISYDYRR